MVKLPFVRRVKAMSDRFKSVWEGIRNFFRYGIGYIGRWIFIGISFIYLITLTIALHEAISFQGSVEGMFTEKSTARRVLVELYNHIGSDGSLPEKTYPVPIGAMAIRLDTLRNAVKELGYYQLKEKKTAVIKAGQPTGETPNPSHKVMNKADDDETNTSPEEMVIEFKNKIGDIKPALISLHDLLFENSPHIKIVETFIEIEKISDELKQYTITVPESADVTDIKNISSTKVFEKDTNVAVKQIPSQQTIDQNNTRGNTFASAQKIPEKEDTTASNETSFQNQAAAEYRVLINGLFKHLKQLNSELEVVKNDLPEETLQAYSKTVKDIEQEIKGLEKHRAAANNFNLSIAKLINLMHTLNENMLDDRQKFNQDLFDSIQSKLQQLTAFQESKRLKVSKKLPEASFSDDYSNTLGGLKNTLKSLEQNIALTEEYKEIEKLKEIALAIYKMKASVASINDLSNIEVQPLPSSSDKNNRLQVETSTAQLRFKNSLGVLSDAIIKLEKEFSAQKPAAMLALIIGPDPQAQSKATTILTDYRSLSEFDAILLPFQKLVKKDNYLHNFGINTRYITTLSYESLTLMFVFVIGAIGSLLYITKHFLHMAMQGHGWLDQPSRPFSWYLFRPIFGIVVALAVYLLVKAGQLALGGSDSLGDLNLPIFSVVALFAGLLSWHALDAIESRGKKWFNVQSRRNMYATGLKHTLDIENKSIAQCANQIGSTEEQVQRWIDYHDKVTPEMQDRLITWLDRTVGELFREEVPENKEGKTPLLPEGSKDEAGEPKDE
jgi:hypothetical protein